MDKRPRGRPRPQATIDRDQSVLECLEEHGPMSRNRLAELLGLEKTIVYLALDRLRRSGQVRICADTAGPGSVWSANVGAPCP